MLIPRNQINVEPDASTNVAIVRKYGGCIYAVIFGLVKRMVIYEMNINVADDENAAAMMMAVSTLWLNCSIIVDIKNVKICGI